MSIRTGFINYLKEINLQKDSFHSSLHRLQLKLYQNSSQILHYEDLHTLDFVDARVSDSDPRSVTFNLYTSLLLIYVIYFTRKSLVVPALLQKQC